MEKFEQYSEFVRGSINSVCAKCNRAGCICEKKSSRKAHRLTYKNNQQKTCIVYIPKNKLPKIRRMIANHLRTKKIMEQLIETNIEIFKESGL